METTFNATLYDFRGDRRSYGGVTDWYRRDNYLVLIFENGSQYVFNCARICEYYLEPETKGGA